MSMLKVKANNNEVNKKLMLLEEKIIGLDFDQMNNNNQVYSQMATKFDQREELLRDIENKLVNKVEMKVMGEVLERVNRLESILNVDLYESTVRSVGSYSALGPEGEPGLDLIEDGDKPFSKSNKMNNNTNGLETKNTNKIQENQVKTDTDDLTLVNLNKVDQNKFLI